MIAIIIIRPPEGEKGSLNAPFAALINGLKQLCGCGYNAGATVRSKNGIEFRLLLSQ